MFFQKGVMLKGPTLFCCCHPQQWHQFLWQGTMRPYLLHLHKVILFSYPARTRNSLTLFKRLDFTISQPFQSFLTHKNSKSKTTLIVLDGHLPIWKIRGVSIFLMHPRVLRWLLIIEDNYMKTLFVTNSLIAQFLHSQLKDKMASVIH